MKRPQRLLCALSLASPTLLATGCLIPYVYPKLSYIPGCDPAGPKVTDVHAFRVDVTADEADMSENRTYTIKPISRRRNGSVSPQLGLSIERGFHVYGPLTYNVGRHHSTRIRLYRPGYQLVELGSWDSTNRIEWRPALDWKVQEQAITDLLACPLLTPTFSGSALRNSLPPRPHSWEERRALVFAAEECDRVAKLAPTLEDVARLMKKAQDLRDDVALSAVGTVEVHTVR